MAILVITAASTLLAFGVAAGQPESCGPENWRACLGVVQAFRQGAATTPPPSEDEARHAIDVLEGACGSGEIGPCLLLADIEARGIDPIVVKDRERARSWTERACGLGVQSACETVRLIDAPPLSAETVDDIQRWVARRALGQWPRRQSTADPDRPLCVAFASDLDPLGVDPPASYLQSFTDVPVVRPLSWCREHEEGDVLALGTVRTPEGWPPHPGVETWSIFYRWDGGIVSLVQCLLRDGDSWKPVACAGHPITPPPVWNNRAEDRRRILQVLEQYAQAWNADGPTEVGGQESARELRMREDTRLEMAGVVVTFDKTGLPPSYVHVALSLMGTFEAGLGRRWPLEPWKQKGAETSIGITLQRTDGWWRAGHWTVRWTISPWSGAVVN